MDRRRRARAREIMQRVAEQKAQVGRVWMRTWDIELCEDGRAVLVYGDERPRADLLAAFDEYAAEIASECAADPWWADTALREAKAARSRPE